LLPCRNTAYSRHLLRPNFRRAYAIERGSLLPQHLLDSELRARRARWRVEEGRRLVVGTEKVVEGVVWGGEMERGREVAL